MPVRKILLRTNLRKDRGRTPPLPRHHSFPEPKMRQLFPTAHHRFRPLPCRDSRSIVIALSVGRCGYGKRSFKHHRTSIFFRKKGGRASSVLLHRGNISIKKSCHFTGMRRYYRAFKIFGRIGKTVKSGRIYYDVFPFEKTYCPFNKLCSFFRFAHTRTD